MPSSFPMLDTLADGHSRLDYELRPGSRDELLAEDGKLRSMWRPFFEHIQTLGLDELTRRWEEAKELIRENGVTYRVYGDPRGMYRPWQLDPLPLLISAAESKIIEAGLIQRARLLEAILADLYGPQQLLRGGHIPPALVFANPAFWRPCHGVPVSNHTYLHLL